MFRYVLDNLHVDVFDPYNMLPIEKTVTCLGERR